MKTLLGLFLMLAMAMGLAACGDKGSDRSSNNNSRDDGYRGRYDNWRDRYDDNRSFTPLNQNSNGQCNNGQALVYMGANNIYCTQTNGINMQNMQYEWYWYEGQTYNHWVSGGTPMMTGHFVYNDGTVYDRTNPDHTNPTLCGIGGGIAGGAIADHNDWSDGGTLAAVFLGGFIANDLCQTSNAQSNSKSASSSRTTFRKTNDSDSTSEDIEEIEVIEVQDRSH
jgi:hypothetical protein